MTCEELWNANKNESLDLWFRSIRFTYGVLNALELDKKKKIKKTKNYKQFEEWKK